MARLPGPTGFQESEERLDDGTLARTRHLPDGPASQLISPSADPWLLIHELHVRIRNARSIEELARIGADLGDCVRRLEHSGRIKRPKNGDAEVREAVKNAIEDQLSVMRQIIFETAWTSADQGIDEGIKTAFLSSLWEVTKEVVEDRLGSFMKKAAEAAKSGRPGDILKAAAEASKGLAESLRSHDGLLRKVVDKMARKGLKVDDRMRYQLRRWLIERLEKAADGMKTVVTLLSGPLVIFVRVFFTPTRVPDDREELYLTLMSLARQIEGRVREIVPPELALPPRVVDTIPNRWPAAPELRMR
jgi:hypothetical protein